MTLGLQGKGSHFYDTRMATIHRRPLAGDSRRHTPYSLLSAIRLGRQGPQWTLETELKGGFDLRDAISVKGQEPLSPPIGFSGNIKLF